MRLPDDPETRYQINITPMIDVIFVVLAFFILSTLFLTRDQGLPVDLPGASNAERPPQKDFTVTVTAAGDIFVNQQPTPLTELKPQIQRQIQPEQPVFVVIQADQAVPHGRVVAVMDELRTLEGARLGIATQPGGSP